MDKMELADDDKNQGTWGWGTLIGDETRINVSLMFSSCVVLIIIFF